MWRERFIRVLIIGVGALLVAGIVKIYAQQQQKQPAFSGLPIKEKIEDLGEDILGKAVKVLPGEPDLGEVSQDNQIDQVNRVDQDNQESEPIEEPVKNIQKQTDTLIESIKKLPEDQIEAIKRQIYKEICEPLLEE